MKSSGLGKKILYIVLAVLFAVICFFSGYLTRFYTQSSATNSYAWAIKTIQENYYEDIPDEDLSNVSLKSIAANLLDAYSTYYTAEEYAAVVASNAGSKSGIGISYSYVDASIGKGIFVNSVIINSPAYKAGLKAGMFIYGAKYINSDGTETYMDFNSKDDLVTFANDRAINEKFTFVTDKGEFELSEKDYTASYCFMSTNTQAWTCYIDDDQVVLFGDDVNRVLTFLPQGCAYLSLSQFYGYAADEMARLIREFNTVGCDTLILDLRSNGGGYVDIMRYMSSLFTAKRSGSSNVAMTAKYKNGTETVSYIESFASDASHLSADTKVYVMANNNTASASEALIGVLISNNVISYSDIYLSDYTEECLNAYGTTKNKRTYGKGIMQTPFKNVATGEVLKLTTAKIYWPNGNCIHDTGITVENGCNTVKADWVITYEDTELRSVVKSIYNLK